MARSIGVGGALLLDAEGLVKLADGNHFAVSFARDAHERSGRVVTAASTIAEVLRGGARDAKLHRVLNQIRVVPVDKQLGRIAGELLGRAGLSGHRCTIDALLAAVALGLPRPVVLLTSDPDDMARLTEEPDRPRAERVAVVRL
jgi:predicted nucleic acid-binding protein